MVSFYLRDEYRDNAEMLTKVFNMFHLTFLRERQPKTLHDFFPECNLGMDGQ